MCGSLWGCRRSRFYKGIGIEGIRDLIWKPLLFGRDSLKLYILLRIYIECMGVGRVDNRCYRISSIGGCIDIKGLILIFNLGNRCNSGWGLDMFGKGIHISCILCLGGCRDLCCGYHSRLFNSLLLRCILYKGVYREYRYGFRIRRNRFDRYSRKDLFFFLFRSHKCNR